MLRQQKIYSDDANNADASAASMSDGSCFVDGKSTTPPTTTATTKPTLQHTYSNLSDKSFVANEPPYTVQTTLVQLDFVKSSFTVNPCMVSFCILFCFFHFCHLLSNTTHQYDVYDVENGKQFVYDAVLFSSFPQSSHSHLFLQGDDKLYINQGDSLQKVYHNGKSFPMDPNLMESNLYSSSSKQSNLFSQSYNICMDSYMSGEFISVPNEGKQTLFNDFLQKLLWKYLYQSICCCHRSFNEFRWLWSWQVVASDEHFIRK